MEVGRGPAISGVQNRWARVRAQKGLHVSYGATLPFGVAFLLWVSRLLRHLLAFRNCNGLGTEDQLKLLPAGICFLLYTFPALPSVTGACRRQAVCGDQRMGLDPPGQVFLKQELWILLVRLIRGFY